MNSDEGIAEVLIAYRRGELQLVPAIERIKEVRPAPEKKPPNPATLERAREHFADKPDSEITVSKVANAIGCSKSTASPIVHALKDERGIAY